MANEETNAALATLDGFLGYNASAGPGTWPRDIFNVKHYGAKGDARKVTDAALTNNSSTVTSATAAFTSADVGKIIFGVETATGLLRLPRGTISSVTNATTIVASTTATGNYTGINLVFGTDDTAEIQAAVAAAKALSPAGEVVVPAGGYLLTARPLDLLYSTLTPSIRFQGAGRGRTEFFLDPTFDIAGIADGHGAFIRDGNALGHEIGGFTVDGSWYGFSASGKHVFEVFGSRAKYRDVEVLYARGFTTVMAVTGSRGSFERLHLEAGGYVGLAIESGASGEFLDCYSGNHGNVSVQISNIDGLSNTAPAVKFLGGLFDESTQGTVTLAAATDVVFVGTRIFGASTKYAVQIDGTSIGRFVGAELIPWIGNPVSPGNRGGLKVLFGGKAYLQATRLDKTGTLYALDNAGLVYDGGGNSGLTAANTTGTPLGAQTLASPWAINIDDDLETIQLPRPASGTQAITMAAPARGGIRKNLCMTDPGGSPSGSMTLTLTNFVGGSAGTTATFDAVGETMIVESNAALKWVILKEFEVTLS